MRSATRLTCQTAFLRAQAAEAAEVAALLAAENVALVAEEDRDRLGPLDALTGAPRADDVLLFALPVRSWPRLAALLGPLDALTDPPRADGVLLFALPVRLTAPAGGRAAWAGAPAEDLRPSAARMGMFAASLVLLGYLRRPDTLEYACLPLCDV